MLIALLVVEIVTLLAVVFLLLRRQQGPDARLGQVPDQLTRLDARNAALDAHIRDAFVQMRSDIAVEAQRTREASAADFAALRIEITGSIATLGQTLQTGLAGFRSDNKSSDDLLRNAVQSQMEGITQRISSFTAETNLQHTNLRESLNTKLNELMMSNTGLQNQLRTAVEERLIQLSKDNSAELEKMRQTVDEKLNETLRTRLTESFGQVTTHLGEVQKGLGEMKELATGVGDLKKVLSNVSRRGGVGEFLVGQQLEQMFSQEQYLKQVNIKRNTGEKVDFALKFPNGENANFILLPIDAKFPTSDWERLEHAYDHGTTSEIVDAGKAFERSIRTQAKSIGEKYIDPPTTMPHAIMVLPTENLYAEVVRRPGLQSEIQSQCRVTIAGPSTFMAILTSFQMGFHTLAIQKKGDEVWRVLSKAKNEFGNFSTLMDKIEKQVGTVQKTIQEINGKTTTINRALKNVSDIDSGNPASSLIGFEEGNGIAPFLAASADDE